MASEQVDLENLRQSLREALAWGATYGPVLKKGHWEEMREKQVEQHVTKLTKK